MTPPLEAVSDKAGTPPAQLPGVSPPRLPAGLRSSQNVIAGAGAAAQITGLYNNYAPLAYMLPFQSLDYIEMIAQYNADFSQAVDNVVTLANSGYNIVITGPARTVRRTHDQIVSHGTTVMAEHGGYEGLIDKLLHQAAVYGAMCGEWLLSEDLKDVVGFADINPKLIRFFWEDNHWAPYQKVGFLQLEEAIKSGQKVRAMGFVKLNEITFRYIGFNAYPMSPYGTPPFLAALQHISTQQDMLFNMSQIVRKVGLLGIIDVVVDQIAKQPGESEESYMNRAKSYLTEYSDAMEDMMTQGGMVHFDDVEVKTTNVAGNAAGATNIFKQNEELLFSGLKSMPSVQGRSYSTTETYAGVAYDIIIRNTRKYQDGVRQMMAQGFWLMAGLWGENPQGIEMDFLPNKTLQRLEEAKATNLEIINSLMMWVMGIWNQETVAHALGQDAPVKPMDTPPSDDPIFGSKPGAHKPTSGEDEGGDPPPPTGSRGTKEWLLEDSEVSMEEVWGYVQSKMVETFPQLEHP